MRKFLASTALSLVIALPAAAANLVSNGSFEDGINGWTIGGVDTQGYPPVAIFYGAAQPYPNGAFGEAVPANNAPTNSPDAVGGRAAYFVTDFAANQSLTQTIFLTPGTYQIGFSAYAPANGYANQGDATFSGTVLDVILADYTVSSKPSTTWTSYQGATDILVAGNYEIKFVFNTNLFPSKDVVIDQVYVIEGNPPPPVVDVPAPAALGLFGMGLLGLAAVRRRRA
ncbi:PEP-CTERM sorting domain-containing protein [Roseomonas sp. AR75]|uniref:PEP-CTERM sorting domain-containing protein n=1 Tax=Roseomonas sp. AR75 TaxID=2562311 RepID=UPI0010BFD110|nr:PEP-CTERM sorting domain-containing protein [Roseomonas sp. AR75]